MFLCGRSGMTMTRQRTTAVAVLTVVLSLDVSASVVITSSVSTTANGKTTQGQFVESIDGQTMRGHWAHPGKQGCRGVGNIYDVAGGRVIVLKCDKQEAEIYDAAKASAEVEKHLPSRLITAAWSSTGRTKDVLGARCEEHSFSLKAPLLDNVMLLRSGTAWVAAEGPGVEEFVAFYRSAENVLVAGSIRAPKTVWAVDRTNTEVYRQIAAMGGRPCELDMKLEVEGGGLAARLLRRSLSFSQTITVTSVDTSPLQGQVFEVPEGWKTKNK